MYVCRHINVELCKKIDTYNILKTEKIFNCQKNRGLSSNSFFIKTYRVPSDLYQVVIIMQKLFDLVASICSL